MSIHRLVDRQLIDGPTEPLSVGRPAPTSGRSTTDSAMVGATEVEDLALIAGIAANDLAALAALYDRYRSAAFGLAVRITRDGSLAEDVVQDAFLGVWRDAARYDARRGGSRTWIMTIVHHRAVDVIRRRRPVSELPTADSASPASLVLPDIWSEVAGRLDRDTIAAALATLGTAQREAIELAYFSGLTQAEIARHTGAPLGTVKSRVRLGLLALRDELAPDYDIRPAAKAGPPPATVSQLGSLGVGPVPKFAGRS
jgi:RNA polymerase sigma-70 factor (ECF subfamily)